MYTVYRPDKSQTIIELARLLGGIVICHRQDIDRLRQAGIAVSSLPCGGPLIGEIWVEVQR